jgi:O-methyltransferase involved in polyketide biosynthesis
MEEGRPSATAIGAAIMRAAHLLLDDDPKIFQDPLALRLSGAESAAALRATYEAMQADVARRSTPEHAQAFGTYSRANMTMRQRYTEEALGQALERGVAQYGPACACPRWSIMSACVRVGSPSGGYS